MKPVTIAAACLALSLLTYFQFPGHTWLQQDSQIYAPILERLSDPSVLKNEILAARPHVAYTLYDETARALRFVTGLNFHAVLAAQQVAARALGIWGLYLLALPLCWAALQGSRPADKRLPPEPLALFVAALCSLGAVIAGPSVATLEYEPTPRAFALPLAICAMGLTVHGRRMAAAVMGAAAFLYHPPTALAFWACFCVIALWPSRSETLSRRLRALIPLAGAALVLVIAARAQQGGGEAQTFFARLTPELERLQRMRAEYNWVTSDVFWTRGVFIHHAVVFAILLAAFARLRREMGLELRLFAIGLPVLGLLSIPASWLLLDHWRWALVPQIQPMRYVLFVTLFAQFLAAVAGVRAAVRRQPAEAACWFAAAYLPSMSSVIGQITLREAATAAGLAAVAFLAVWLGTARKPVALLAGLAAFFAIPGIGGVVNYPQLHTPELEQLSVWARSSTSKDAVFQFADVGKGSDPGIFRAEAVRAVYVDWKGGGQINYIAGFAQQWWFRWQLMNQNRFRPRDLPKYEGLGIRYVVLQPKNRLPARTPVFESPKYLVYDLKS